jgi:N-acetylmuramoyl-L-alanine amidase
VVDGLLQGVRLGQNTLTKTRVVIDVETVQRHRVFVLTHPHRLVLDVYGPRVRREGRDGSARGREASRRSPATLPSELRAVQTVILDPGHGGRDPGAIGVGGLQEKGVTLRLARALAPRLTKQGFRVVFTREDDRFVSLEERTAIAEAARGDLFISLHANASRRRSLNGIETYYLDKDYERHSMTVAARENGIEPGEVNSLQRTLAKFRVSANSRYSRKLARLVQKEIVEGLTRKRRPVQDLGVKKGPFYVLFLSDTPAILVEAGFLTNRMEAKRLADSGYIDAVAEQIADALVTYRSSAEHFAMRGVFEAP